MSNSMPLKWFTETELPFGREGVRIDVAYTDVLYDHQSQFGHIQILDTPFYGKMLTLDGIIQTTTSDEFIYHEMMVALPSLVHGAVKRMLIIGGGDGGALRQAIRFPGLEAVTQVEIDDLVTLTCREYLPEISQNSFDDPRVELIYMDGAEYIKSCTQTFDLVVLDLTDPIPGGPAEALFGESFLEDVKAILAPGGMVMMQCGSLLFQPDEVKQQVTRFRELFSGNARLHTAVMPGYQLTTFGFLLGSIAPLATPDADTLQERMGLVRGNFQYLSPEVFAASSVLPPYLAAQVL